MAKEFTFRMSHWTGAKLPTLPQSIKIREAMGQIEEWVGQDPKRKIVVFTLSVGMLDILESSCRQANIKASSYHGEMSENARAQALNQWKEEDIPVLIATMQSAGDGIDMTAGSRMIISDLWWNSSREHQAMGRIFRPNQKQAVEIVKLVVVDTIDERILELQNAKFGDILNAITGIRQPGPALKELMGLFGNTHHAEEEVEEQVQNGMDPSAELDKLRHRHLGDDPDPQEPATSTILGDLEPNEIDAGNGAEKWETSNDANDKRKGDKDPDYTPDDADKKHDGAL